MNVITDYKSVISDISDVSDDYAEASALFLLSTAVGRQFYYMSVQDYSFNSKNMTSGKYLNLWFQVLGKSRVSRKTFTFNKQEDIMEEIIPTVRMSDVFTPEKLISELSQKSKDNGGVAHASWTYDECRAFFESLKSKDYMASTDSKLCKLYDCRKIIATTVSRGQEIVDNPYLTVWLSSTLSLPQTYHENMMETGFLNRFLFVLDKKRKLRPSSTGYPSSETQALLASVKARLTALYSNESPQAMALDEQATASFKTYEERLDAKIEADGLGVREGWFANTPDFIKKITCLHRLARIDDYGQCDTPRTVMLANIDDLEYAKKYVEKSATWLDVVVDSMKKPSKKAQETQSDDDFVLSKIRLAGTRGLTMSELMHKVQPRGIHSAQLFSIIGNLNSASRVKTTKESSGGRPVEYVKVV